MKIRHSFFFLILGIILIGAGFVTQMVGTAHAKLPQKVTQPNQVVPPFTDIACLECHTNQDQLQRLAVEEEVVESLSEGPG